MNYEFNKQEHIKKMTPHVKKLVVYLNSIGISFSATDGELENVVLTRNDGKVIKIAYHCFYRFSGMCKIRKDIGKNLMTLVDVTDDMFINQYEIHN